MLLHCIYHHSYIREEEMRGGSGRCALRTLLVALARTHKLARGILDGICVFVVVGLFVWRRQNDQSTSH